MDKDTQQWFMTSRVLARYHASGVRPFQDFSDAPDEYNETSEVSFVDGTLTLVISSGPTAHMRPSRGVYLYDTTDGFWTFLGDIAAYSEAGPTISVAMGTNQPPASLNTGPIPVESVISGKPAETNGRLLQNGQDPDGPLRDGTVERFETENLVTESSKVFRRLSGSELSQVTWSASNVTAAFMEENDTFGEGASWFIWKLKDGPWYAHWMQSSQYLGRDQDNRIHSTAIYTGRWNGTSSSLAGYTEAPIFRSIVKDTDGAFLSYPPNNEGVNTWEKDTGSNYQADKSPTFTGSGPARGLYDDDTGTVTALVSVSDSSTYTFIKDPEEGVRVYAESHDLPSAEYQFEGDMVFDESQKEVRPSESVLRPDRPVTMPQSGGKAYPGDRFNASLGPPGDFPSTLTSVYMAWHRVHPVRAAADRLAAAPDASFLSQLVAEADKAAAIQEGGSLWDAYQKAEIHVKKAADSLVDPTPDSLLFRLAAMASAEERQAAISYGGALRPQYNDLGRDLKSAAASLASAQDGSFLFQLAGEADKAAAIQEGGSLREAFVGSDGSVKAAAQLIAEASPGSLLFELASMTLQQARQSAIEDGGALASEIAQLEPDQQQAASLLADASDGHFLFELASEHDMKEAIREAGSLWARYYSSDEDTQHSAMLVATADPDSLLHKLAAIASAEDRQKAIREGGSLRDEYERWPGANMAADLLAAAQNGEFLFQLALEDDKAAAIEESGSLRELYAVSDENTQDAATSLAYAGPGSLLDKLAAMASTEERLEAIREGGSLRADYDLLLRDDARLAAADLLATAQDGSFLFQLTLEADKAAAIEESGSLWTAYSDSDGSVKTAAGLIANASPGTLLYQLAAMETAQKRQDAISEGGSLRTDYDLLLRQPAVLVAADLLSAAQDGSFLFQLALEADKAASIKEAGVLWTAYAGSDDDIRDASRLIADALPGTPLSRLARMRLTQERYFAISPGGHLGSRFSDLGQDQKASADLLAAALDGSFLFQLAGEADKAAAIQEGGSLREAFVGSDDGVKAAAQLIAEAPSDSLLFRLAAMASAEERQAAISHGGPLRFEYEASDNEAKIASALLAGLADRRLLEDLAGLPSQQDRQAAIGEGGFMRGAYDASEQAVRTAADAVASGADGGSLLLQLAALDSRQDREAAIVEAGPLSAAYRALDEADGQQGAVKTAADLLVGELADNEFLRDLAALGTREDRKAAIAQEGSMRGDYLAANPGEQQSARTLADATDPGFLADLARIETMQKRVGAIAEGGLLRNQYEQAVQEDKDAAMAMVAEPDRSFLLRLAALPTKNERAASIASGGSMRSIYENLDTDVKAQADLKAAADALAAADDDDFLVELGRIRWETTRKAATGYGDTGYGGYLSFYYQPLADKSVADAVINASDYGFLVTLAKTEAVNRQAAIDEGGDLRPYWAAASDAEKNAAARLVAAGDQHFLVDLAAVSHHGREAALAQGGELREEYDLASASEKYAASRIAYADDESFLLDLAVMATKELRQAAIAQEGAMRPGYEASTQNVQLAADELASSEDDGLLLQLAALDSRQEREAAIAEAGPLSAAYRALDEADGQQGAVKTAADLLVAEAEPSFILDLPRLQDRAAALVQPGHLYDMYIQNLDDDLAQVVEELLAAKEGSVLYELAAMATQEDRIASISRGGSLERRYRSYAGIEHPSYVVAPSIASTPEGSLRLFPEEASRRFLPDSDGLDVEVRNMVRSDGAVVGEIDFSPRLETLEVDKSRVVQADGEPFVERVAPGHPVAFPLTQAVGEYNNVTVLESEAKAAWSEADVELVYDVEAEVARSAGPGPVTGKDILEPTGGNTVSGLGEPSVQTVTLARHETSGDVVVVSGMTGPTGSSDGRQFTLMIDELAQPARISVESDGSLTARFAHESLVPVSLNNATIRDSSRQEPVALVSTPNRGNAVLRDDAEGTSFTPITVESFRISGFSAYNSTNVGAYVLDRSSAVPMYRSEQTYGTTNKHLAFWYGDKNRWEIGFAGGDPGYYITNSQDDVHPIMPGTSSGSTARDILKIDGANPGYNSATTTNLTVTAVEENLPFFEVVLPGHRWVTQVTIGCTMETGVTLLDGSGNELLNPPQPLAGDEEWRHTVLALGGDVGAVWTDRIRVRIDTPKAMVLGSGSYQKQQFRILVSFYEADHYYGDTVELLETRDVRVTGGVPESAGTVIEYLEGTYSPVDPPDVPGAAVNQLVIPQGGADVLPTDIPTHQTVRTYILPDQVHYDNPRGLSAIAGFIQDTTSHGDLTLRNRYGLISSSSGNIEAGLIFVVKDDRTLALEGDASFSYMPDPQTLDDLHLVRWSGLPASSEDLALLPQDRLEEMTPDAGEPYLALLRSLKGGPLSLAAGIGAPLFSDTDARERVGAAQGGASLPLHEPGVYPVGSAAAELLGPGTRVLASNAVQGESRPVWDPTVWFDVQPSDMGRYVVARATYRDSEWGAHASRADKGVLVPLDLGMKGGEIRQGNRIRPVFVEPDDGRLYEYEFVVRKTVGGVSEPAQGGGAGGLAAAQILLTQAHVGDFLGVRLTWRLDGEVGSMESREFVEVQDADDPGYIAVDFDSYTATVEEVDEVEAATQKITWQRDIALIFDGSWAPHGQRAHLADGEFLVVPESGLRNDVPAGVPYHDLSLTTTQGDNVASALARVAPTRFWVSNPAAVYAALRTHAPRDLCIRAWQHDPYLSADKATRAAASALAAASYGSLLHSVAGLDAPNRLDAISAGGSLASIYDSQGDNMREAADLLAGAQEGSLLYQLAGLPHEERSSAVSEGGSLFDIHQAAGDDTKAAASALAAASEGSLLYNLAGLDAPNRLGAINAGGSLRGLYDGQGDNMREAADLLAGAQEGSLLYELAGLPHDKRSSAIDNTGHLIRARAEYRQIPPALLDNARSAEPHGVVRRVEDGAIIWLDVSPPGRPVPLGCTKIIVPDTGLILELAGIGPADESYLGSSEAWTRQILTVVGGSGLPAEGASVLGLAEEENFGLTTLRTLTTRRVHYVAPAAPDPAAFLLEEEVIEVPVDGTSSYRDLLCHDWVPFFVQANTSNDVERARAIYYLDDDDGRLKLFETTEEAAQYEGAFYLLMQEVPARAGLALLYGQSSDGWELECRTRGVAKSGKEKSEGYAFVDELGRSIGRFEGGEVRLGKASSGITGEKTQFDGLQEGGIYALQSASAQSECEVRLTVPTRAVYAGTLEAATGEHFAPLALSSDFSSQEEEWARIRVSKDGTVVIERNTGTEALPTAWVTSFRGGVASVFKLYTDRETDEVNHHVGTSADSNVMAITTDGFTTLVVEDKVTLDVTLENGQFPISVPTDGSVKVTSDQAEDKGSGHWEFTYPTQTARPFSRVENNAVTNSFTVTYNEGNERRQFAVRSKVDGRRGIPESMSTFYRKTGQPLVWDGAHLTGAPADLGATSLVVDGDGDSVRRAADLLAAAPEGSLLHKLAAMGTQKDRQKAIDTGGSLSADFESTEDDEERAAVQLLSESVAGSLLHELAGVEAPGRPGAIFKGSLRDHFSSADGQTREVAEQLADAPSGSFLDLLSGVTPTGYQTTKNARIKALREGGSLRDAYDTRGDEARAAADLLASAEDGSLLYKLAVLDASKRPNAIQPSGDLYDSYESAATQEIREAALQLAGAHAGSFLDSLAAVMWGAARGALQEGSSLYDAYHSQGNDARADADLLAGAQEGSLLYELAALPQDEREDAMGENGKLANLNTGRAALKLASATVESLLGQLALVDATERSNAIRPVGTLRSLYDEQGDNARDAADLLAGAESGSLLYDLANLPPDQRGAAIDKDGSLYNAYQSTEAAAALADAPRGSFLDQLADMDPSQRSDAIRSGSLRSLYEGQGDDTRKYADLLAGAVLGELLYDLAGLEHGQRDSAIQTGGALYEIHQAANDDTKAAASALTGASVGSLLHELAGLEPLKRPGAIREGSLKSLYEGQGDDTRKAADLLSVAEPENLLYDLAGLEHDQRGPAIQTGGALYEIHQAADVDTKAAALALAGASVGSLLHQLAGLDPSERPGAIHEGSLVALYEGQNEHTRAYANLLASAEEGSLLYELAGKADEERQHAIAPDGTLRGLYEDSDEGTQAAADLVAGAENDTLLHKLAGIYSESDRSLAIGGKLRDEYERSDLPDQVAAFRLADSAQGSLLFELAAFSTQQDRQAAIGEGGALGDTYQTSSEALRLAADRLAGAEVGTMLYKLAELPSYERMDAIEEGELRDLYIRLDDDEQAREYAKAVAGATDDHKLLYELAKLPSPNRRADAIRSKGSLRGQYETSLRARAVASDLATAPSTSLLYKVAAEADASSRQAAITGSLKSLYDAQGDGVRRAADLLAGAQQGSLLYELASIYDRDGAIQEGGSLHDQYREVADVSRVAEDLATASNESLLYRLAGIDAQGRLSAIQSEGSLRSLYDDQGDDTRQAADLLADAQADSLLFRLAEMPFDQRASSIGPDGSLEGLYDGQGDDIRQAADLLAAANAGSLLYELAMIIQRSRADAIADGGSLRDEYDAQGNEARAAADLLAYSDEGSLLYEMAALSITQRRKSITAGDLADDYLAHNGRPLVVETQGRTRLRAITDQGRLVDENVTVRTQLTPRPIACELETTSLLFWLAEEPAGERVSALQGSLRTLYDDQPPEAQEAADLLASAQADSLLYDLANLPHDQRSSAIEDGGSLYSAYVNADDNTKAAASALAAASNGSLLYNLAVLDAPKRPGAIRPVGTLRSLYDEQGDNARNAADLLAGAQEGSLLYALANLPHDQRGAAIDKDGSLRSLYDAELPKVREAADLLASATSWSHEHRIKLDFSRWEGAQIAANATSELNAMALSQTYALTWSIEEQKAGEGPVFTSTGAIGLQDIVLGLPADLVKDVFGWSSPSSVAVAEDVITRDGHDVKLPTGAIRGTTVYRHKGVPGYYLSANRSGVTYDWGSRYSSGTSIPGSDYGYSTHVVVNDLKEKLERDFEARDDSIVGFSEGDGRARVGDILQATDDANVFLEVARLSGPKEQRGEGYVVEERLASDSTWRVAALDDDAYAVTGGVSWDGNLFVKKGQDDGGNPYYLSSNERYMLRRSKAYPDLWVVILSGLVQRDVNNYAQGETTGRLAIIQDSVLNSIQGSLLTSYYGSPETERSAADALAGSSDLLYELAGLETKEERQGALAQEGSLHVAYEGASQAFQNAADLVAASQTGELLHELAGLGTRQAREASLAPGGELHSSYDGSSVEVRAAADAVAASEPSILYQLAGLNTPEERAASIVPQGSLRSLYDLASWGYRSAADALAASTPGGLLHALVGVGTQSEREASIAHGGSLRYQYTGAPAHVQVYATRLAASPGLLFELAGLGTREARLASIAHGGSLRVAYEGASQAFQNAADLVAASQTGELLHDLAGLGTRPAREASLAPKGSLRESYEGATQAMRDIADQLVESESGLLHDLAGLATPEQRLASIAGEGPLRAFYEIVPDDVRDVAERLAASGTGLLYDIANLATPDQRAGSIQAGGSLRAAYDDAPPDVQAAASTLAGSQPGLLYDLARLETREAREASIAEGGSLRASYDHSQDEVRNAADRLAASNDGLLYDLAILATEELRQTSLLFGGSLHAVYNEAPPEVQTAAWALAGSRPGLLYKLCGLETREERLASIASGGSLRVAYEGASQAFQNAADLVAASQTGELLHDLAGLGTRQAREASISPEGELRARYDGSSVEVRAAADVLAASEPGILYQLAGLNTPEERAASIVPQGSLRSLYDGASSEAQAHADLLAASQSGVLHELAALETQKERFESILPGSPKSMSIWNFVLGSVVDGNPTASRPLVFPESLEDGGTVSFFRAEPATSDYHQPWYGKGVKKDDPLLLRVSQTGDVLARLIWRGGEGEGSYKGYTFEVDLAGDHTSLSLEGYGALHITTSQPVPSLRRVSGRVRSVEAAQATDNVHSGAGAEFSSDGQVVMRGKVAKVKGTSEAVATYTGAEFKSSGVPRSIDKDVGAICSDLVDSWKVQDGVNNRYGGKKFNTAAAILGADQLVLQDLRQEWRPGEEEIEIVSVIDVS